MNLVERAKGIILKPSETWAEIKAEQISISDLYKSYAVILAAIPAIAQFIGSSVIGYSFMGAHFRMGISNTLGSAIVSYILSLIGIYIVAIIADALAPTFGSTKNITNAFKAVVYSMTPSWVAGVLFIFPPLSILAIIARTLWHLSLLPRTSHDDGYTNGKGPRLCDSGDSCDISNKSCHRCNSRCYLWTMACGRRDDRVRRYRL